LNLGNRLAGFVVLALVSLSLVLIGCAFFADNMAIFSEEHVEVRPSTIAALVHVVAGHEHLGWNNRGLLSIL
jgi:hypothetical protein